MICLLFLINKPQSGGARINPFINFRVFLVYALLSSSMTSEHFQSCDVRPKVEKGLIFFFFFGGGVLCDHFLAFFFFLCSLYQSGGEIL